MISTVRLHRTLILSVAVEHPDGWSGLKIRKAVESMNLAEEVDWGHAEVATEVGIVHRDQEEPSDPDEEPVVLNQADLVSDTGFTQSARDEEEQEDDDVAGGLTADLGFGDDDDE